MTYLFTDIKRQNNNSINDVLQYEQSFKFKI